MLAQLFLVLVRNTWVRLACTCMRTCTQARTWLCFLTAASRGSLMSRRQSCMIDERSTNGVPNHEACHVMLTCCGGGTMASVPAVVMNADNSHELCSSRPRTQRLSCRIRTLLDPADLSGALSSSCRVSSLCFDATYHGQHVTGYMLVD